MRLKKTFGILFFLILALTLFSFPAFAGIETPPIYVGGGEKNYYYTVTEEGVTITGPKKAPGSTVLIPSLIEEKPVIAIGDGAFRDRTGVSRVVLPDTVCSIGAEAFCGCTSLEYVSLSENVTSVGRDAFHGTIWFGLLPEGVAYVGKIALGIKGPCPASLTLSEGTVGIADGAFETCEALSSVNLPRSLKAVGESAFSSFLTSVWYTGSPADRNVISFSDENEWASLADWHYVDGESDTACNECGLGRAVSDLVTAGLSLSVEERIYLNLWLDAEGIAEYRESYGKDFSYEAFVNIGGEKVSLGSGTVTGLPTESEYGSYFVLRLSALPANHFDKTIEVVSPIFTINTMEGQDLNLLNLAQGGIADGHDEKKTNLFRALYNYGASATGNGLVPLPDGFLKDEGNDPVYGIRSHEAVSFSGMQLLMGDAIGIRLLGKASGGVEGMTLSVTVDGQKNERFLSEKDLKGDGNLFLDLYVSAEFFSSELDITVSVNGYAVLRLKTDVKGYSEQANNGSDVRTLALAQLVQACTDM